MLRGVLDEASGKWGIRVSRVEIKAIDPPKSVKDAMEKQMRAEREKRAAILTAEGVRQSKILTAEGEKQSAILTAEGAKQSAILRAEGQAQAIATVFQAVHDNDPDPKLLAYQYLQTLPQLAQGAGNTFWVIPSEVTTALKSVASAFSGVEEPAGTGQAAAGSARPKRDPVGSADGEASGDGAKAVEQADEAGQAALASSRSPAALNAGEPGCGGSRPARRRGPGCRGWSIRHGDRDAGRGDPWCRVRCRDRHRAAGHPGHHPRERRHPSPGPRSRFLIRLSRPSAGPPRPSAPCPASLPNAPCRNVPPALRPVETADRPAAKGAGQASRSTTAMTTRTATATNTMSLVWRLELGAGFAVCRKASAGPGVVA